jgi:hypothetical protein
MVGRVGLGVMAEMAETVEMVAMAGMDETVEMVKIAKLIKTGGTRETRNISANLVLTRQRISKRPLGPTQH